MSSTASSKCSGGNKTTDNDRASTGTDTSNAWSDVVLVVGGVEFHESSHFLRASSDYFEAAFRSGMKEAQTKRFEFPDKDPEGWRLIKSLIQPFSTATITAESAEKLLPWFDELCMPKGLMLCDETLGSLATQNFNQTNTVGDKEVQGALEGLTVSARYRLPMTKVTRCDFIYAAFQTNLFQFASKENLRVLFEVMLSDETCRDKFFSLFQSYLPAAESADQLKMLSNNLLPALVATEIHKESLVSTIQKCRASKNVGALRADLQQIGILTSSNEARVGFDRSVQHATKRIRLGSISHHSSDSVEAASVEASPVAQDEYEPVGNRYLRALCR
eukprot:Sro2509_g329760.1 n/a (332) ;mRNA; r:2980-3975